MRIIEILIILLVGTYYVIDSIKQSRKNDSIFKGFDIVKGWGIVFFCIVLLILIATGKVVLFQF